MSLTLRNGSPLPLVGFGTSAGASSESEIERFLDAALRAGYRHFDTASIYSSETVIGRTIRKWIESGKLTREEVFITTKLSVPGVHPDRVEYFIEKSLANLQLDYIDLYLVHFPVGTKYDPDTYFVFDKDGNKTFEGPTDHVAIWKKMEEQVDRGRTRYIGLSNYTIPQMETVLAAARIKPACLQLEFHPYLQQWDHLEFCHKNGILVVGYQPLGAPDYNKRMKSFFKDEFKEQAIGGVLENPVVSRLGQKYSKSPAQIVLRFLTQIGVYPIPKSTNPQRMKENLQICDFELEEEDVNRLRELDVGEDARISTFKNFLPGIENHPDYPFPK